VTAADFGPGADVLAAFGAPGPAARLPGGSRPVFRAGGLVFKRIGPTSLEHHRSLELFPWLAALLHRLPADGFRLARPLQTRDGRWRTPEGWTAWSYQAGRPAGGADVPACIQAIGALHRALQRVPRPPLLEPNESVFGWADRACWGARPEHLPAETETLIDALYELRRPVAGLRDQLVHADLNPGNILLEPGLQPAFLDPAPFWRPAEFALAIFANWIGPRRGDAAVLRHFAEVPNFQQLLIRAGIRMLLIMTTDLDQFEHSSEARAARIILDYVRAPGSRGGTLRA
jgi:hypothetical protein